MSHRRRLLVLSTALIAALAVVAGASAAGGGGALDKTFSGDGRLRAPNPTNNAFEDYEDSVVDERGRLTVVSTGGSTPDRDFRVTRYRSNGSLDPAFSGNGVAEFDVLGINEQDTPRALAIDESGRIVVVGSANDGTSGTFAALRLLRDGSLDGTFSNGDGSNGVYSIDISNDNDPDIASAVEFDGAGRIVVGGTSGIAPNNDFSVVRLLASGAPDNSFDGNGVQGTSFPSSPSNDRANDLAIDAQGRIILAGSTSTSLVPANVALVRYLPGNGDEDSSFGQNGALVRDISPGDQDTADAVLTRGNKILLGGYAQDAGVGRMLAVQLRSNGMYDSSFGNGGIAKVEFPESDDYAEAFDIAEDGSGNIVLAGTMFNGNSLTALARLNESGSGLDRSFSGDGRVAFGYGAGSDSSASTVSIDPVTGRIVTGGYAIVDSDPFLAAARLEAVPRCFRKAPTIVGTDRGQRLRGTNGPDVIFGDDGNDTLLGRGGRDRLCGGAGRDKLKGGPGRDKLDGGPGRDTERQ